MATHITSHKEIPNAPWYVCCNDSFMSGWGHARGLTNTLILPCFSYAEALAVAEYAESRSEQKYVRINMHKPRLNNDTHYYQVMERKDSSAWYCYKEK